MKNIRFTFKLINIIGCSCKSKQFYSTRSDVRVRFAPSPTGLLHLGGLRTAVYNYLFAKSKGGVFILRIEDTDQNRLVPGAVERLQTDLEWVGIIPDEGPSSGGNYGPYKQSQRLDLYKQEVEKLIKNGSAYYCFCTERRLDLLRKEAIKLRQVPKYDNRCRHLSKEEIETKLENSTNYCVRFKLSPGGQSFDDLVYGTITHDVASVEGDPIILKTDGFPTYHLANVVDDHYMKISHVLRGVEWQPSTAKHLLLYKAFQWKPPLFGHLPLLVNPDGTKFSKRQGANAVEAYRNDSIYPRSLVNFVTFTGGLANMEGEVHSPRTFSMEELFKIFNLSYINTHPCRLMFDQLPEFNRAELSRQISDEESLKLLIKDLRQLVIDTVASKNNDTDVSNLQLDDDHLRNILKWCPPRATKLKDLVEPNLLFLWKQPSFDQMNSSDIQQHKELLKHLVEGITKIENFNQTALNNELRQFAKNHGIKFGLVMKILRLSLCGLKEGPGVGETMEILGKECCLRRLKRVIEAQCDNETSSCRSRV